MFTAYQPAAPIDIVILRRASARRRICGLSAPEKSCHCRLTADPSTPARKRSAPTLRMTIRKRSVPF